MVLFAIVAWGDRWTGGDEGPPVLLRHQGCGELTQAEIRCARCGEPLHADEVTVEAGPGWHRQTERQPEGVADE